MFSNEEDSSAQFEKYLSERCDCKERYILRLFVTGMTPRSVKAIQNIKKICEENLQGRYELEIIDVYQNPERVKNEQILAAPTLIKALPPPLRRIIGDMSDEDRVIVALDLLQKK